MRVRWTVPALRDLTEIGAFIARENASAASRIVTGVLDRVELLSTQPHMGRLGRVAGTREFVISGTPYIVAYRASRDEIQILALLHGAQRWPARFD